MFNVLKKPPTDVIAIAKSLPTGGGANTSFLNMHHHITLDATVKHGSDGFLRMKADDFIDAFKNVWWGAYSVTDPTIDAESSFFKRVKDKFVPPHTETAIQQLLNGVKRANASYVKFLIKTNDISNAAFKAAFDPPERTWILESNPGLTVTITIHGPDGSKFVTSSVKGVLPAELFFILETSSESSLKSIGGNRKKKTPKATYKRTQRTHTSKDGTKRTVYTKGGHDYVRRISKKTKKARYQRVSRVSGGIPV